MKKLVALFLVAGSLLSGCGATTSTTQSTSSAQASSSSTTISESTADSSKEQIEKKKEEEKQKAEKAALEKKVTEAESALSQAEANPTKENYATASAAIQALPENKQELTSRLAAIDSTIKAKEAEEERKKQEEIARQQAEQAQQEAIAQQQAEQARQQAAAEQASQQAQAAAPEQNNEQTVYVTPTGSKYHTHKCGNGTYTPATLSEAQARGLTPCSKCYGN
ncbi:MAG: hypothetical protein E6X16_04135 [Enterococcus faecium]|uniref:hypothetical protein n=1 Tax=Enterococcus faecium TaxID=1352 RepID=UPI000353568C|nr:hypothetical protein [Enterococcus faecium]EPI23002.1 hypothetical protein D353_00634 [Enterococcus faecium OC2A-1]MDU4954812.1 hypothetical protein [Enterococcus faecium]